MKSVVLTLAILLLLPGAVGFAQQTVKTGPKVPADFCINQAENKLHRMVNDYRKRNSLPPIPLSKSLSYVAVLHAKDLYLNKPEQGDCNFHSWSDKGPWKAFCYPGDENKKNSVWDKAKELTRYPGKAYEIIYWENTPAGIDTIMSVWKSEPYFRSFLLSNGKWEGKRWNAIGIGIYENYACAWFGEVADPEGVATVCGDHPLPVKSDSVKNNKAALPKQKEKKSLQTAPVAKTTGAPDSLQIESSSSPAGLYHVIIKSGLPMQQATEMVTKLKAEGYPDCRVLEKDGKARISVFESPSKTEATKKLADTKKKYRDAWLLKN